jgi:hypothetical protein
MRNLADGHLLQLIEPKKLEQLERPQLADHDSLRLRQRRELATRTWTLQRVSVVAQSFVLQTGAAEQVGQF